MSDFRSHPQKVHAERLLGLAAALRHGDFQQGFEALRVEREGGLHHCCLGVGCELRRRIDPSTALWRKDDNRFHVEYPGAGEGADSDGALLPGPVADFYGIDNHGHVSFHKSEVPDEIIDKIEREVGNSYPVSDPKVVEVELYQLNDAGFSFEEIAEIVEAHAKELARRYDFDKPEPSTEVVLAFAPVNTNQNHKLIRVYDRFEEVHRALSEVSYLAEGDGHLTGESRFDWQTDCYTYEFGSEAEFFKAERLIAGVFASAQEEETTA